MHYDYFYGLWLNKEVILLPHNSHLGSHGKNLQATGWDLGGKLEQSAVTWYSTSPSRPIPSEAKGGGSYESIIRFLIYENKNNYSRT